MRTVFLAIITLVLGSFSALGSPLDLSYTHHTAFAVPEQSYQIAKLRFLSDYQGNYCSKCCENVPGTSGDRVEMFVSTAMLRSNHKRPRFYRGISFNDKSESGRLKYLGL